MATAAPIKLEALEKNIPFKILSARNATGNYLKIRTQIVLAAAEKHTNHQIQNLYKIEEHHEFWRRLDPDLRPKMNEKLVIAVTCEPPSQSGYPNTHWNVCWLNANIKDQEIFEQKVGKTCETYLNAGENERKGIHTISVDEKTGIQALERDSPTQPMRPSQPVRMECFYTRHGTTCLFGNLNVATGTIVAPMLHSTRTSEQFAENIDRIVIGGSEQRETGRFPCSLRFGRTWEEWDIKVAKIASFVFGGCESSYSFCSYAETLFVVESD